MKLSHFPNDVWQVLTPMLGTNGRLKMIETGDPIIVKNVTKYVKSFEISTVKVLSKPFPSPLLHRWTFLERLSIKLEPDSIRNSWSESLTIMDVPLTVRSIAIEANIDFIVNFFGPLVEGNDAIRRSVTHQPSHIITKLKLFSYGNIASKKMDDHMAKFFSVVLKSLSTRSLSFKSSIGTSKLLHYLPYDIEGIKLGDLLVTNPDDLIKLLSFPHLTDVGMWICLSIKEPSDKFLQALIMLKQSSLRKLYLDIKERPSGYTPSDIFSFLPKTLSRFKVVSDNLELACYKLLPRQLTVYKEYLTYMSYTLQNDEDGFHLPSSVTRFFCPRMLMNPNMWKFIPKNLSTKDISYLNIYDNMPSLADGDITMAECYKPYVKDIPSCVKRFVFHYPSASFLQYRQSTLNMITTIRCSFSFFNNDHYNTFIYYLKQCVNLENLTLFVKSSFDSCGWKSKKLRNLKINAYYDNSVTPYDLTLPECWMHSLESLEIIQRGSVASVIESIKDGYPAVSITGFKLPFNLRTLKITNVILGEGNSVPSIVPSSCTHLTLTVPLSIKDLEFKWFADLPSHLKTLEVLSVPFINNGEKCNRIYSYLSDNINILENALAKLPPFIQEFSLYPIDERVEFVTSPNMIDMIDRLLFNHKLLHEIKIASEDLIYLYTNFLLPIG